MVDVIEHGDDRPRRPWIGTAVGAAALLALVAIGLSLRTGGERAGPAPMPVRTVSPPSPPSPSPKPSPRPTARLAGPLRSAPTGLRLFVMVDATLHRYDVDSGELPPIRGLGDLAMTSTFVVPWGRGHAVLVTPRAEGYENPAATVYLLPAGATRARRIGTAHYLVPGQRAGDVAFVTHSESRPVAVTYDAAGRRLRSHRLELPADQPAMIFAEARSGLGYVAFETNSLTVHVGTEARTYRERSFVGGRMRTVVTGGVACPQQICSIFVGDLSSNTEAELPLRAGEVASEVVFSPDARRGLLRTTVVDTEGNQYGENVYVLDVAARTLTPVAGAERIDPLTTVGWASSGTGAFLASNADWAYWTPDGGLELLRSSTVARQVVGVG